MWGLTLRATVASGVRVDGEDADHGRVQVEGLGPHRRVPESWSRSSSSRAALWRCSPWPAAAGLGGDGNASAGSKSLAELVESLGRCWPEPEGVDGEDCVEGTTEGGRQLIDRGPAQADPSGGDGGGVTTGRKIQGDSEGQECRLGHRSPPGPADRRRRSASWVSHAPLWAVRPKPGQWACGTPVICGVPDGTRRSESTVAMAAATVNTVKASVNPSIEGVRVRPAAATVEASATQMAAPTWLKVCTMPDITPASC